ncbi:nucleotidyltransferase domain-containing protein [Phyllobacterium leguminum]|uniref:Polymerase nucleotidyl transferase domain-containing protein n=1 Tax=Phyllobacterium leguminum TaxID=314237 RepID=A0A318SZ73_9HYPH|nr:nucleotidyltransferase domain-containing protein [Phyllobacterium leguminum]PYE86684.1 hypothetical protein C7477_12149 [Phyllobacterium leguminum]
MLNSNPPFAEEIRRFFYEQFSEEGEAIALAGSQALGYATSRSDIDLVLLIKPSSGLSQSDMSFLTQLISGRRTEILILTPGTIEERFARTKAEKYNNLGYSDRRFIERISTAIPIVGEQRWNAILTSFDRDTYVAQMLRDNLTLASKSFDDLVGLYVDGDYINAVDAVRFLLQVELEALLCTFGDTGDRRRWLLRRAGLIKDLDPKVTSGFTEYNFNMINNKFSTNFEWIENAMRFHQYIQCQILIKKYHADIGNLICSDYNTHSSAFITPSLLFLDCVNETWYVKTAKESRVIDETSSFILMICHLGQNINNIAYYFSLISPALATSSDTIKFLSSRIDQLVDLGLLTKNAS